MTKFIQQGAQANVAAVNRDWAAGLDNVGLRTKTSQDYRDAIMTHVKEFSVYTTILPPREIDISELEFGHDNDSMFYRIHVLPDTRAGLSSFGSRGGQYQEVFAERFFGTFQLLQTPNWEFNEYRMAAYPFALPKMIEDNVGIDFQETRDWVIHRGLEEMIAKNRTSKRMVYKGANVTAAVGAAGQFDRVKLDVADFVTLRRHFSSRSNGISNVLMPESNYIDLSEMSGDRFGDQLQGEVTVSGYTRSTVSGLSYIRTVKIDETKGDVFRRDNVYAFGQPAEIGRHFDYQGVKTWLTKDAQFIRFAARMAFGQVWAGNDRIAKIELYQTGKQPDARTNLSGYASDVEGNDVYGVSDRLWSDPELAAEHDFTSIDGNPQVPVVEYV